MVMSFHKERGLLLDDVWEDCLEQFIDNKSTFIDKVINTRNYLIHYDESSRNNAVLDSQLFYLAQRLKVLLIVQILIQIGISRTTVYTAVKQFDSFEYLKCK